MKDKLIKINKIAVCMGLVYSIATSIFTQSVSESEVKSSKKVVFQNKNFIKAAPAIRNFHESIGKKLATSLQEKPDQSHFYDGVTLSRIFPDKNLLGADILYLDDSTDIGHINTIQRIISGYIQQAYQYNEENAFFLARYILYYNAINRGKIDYILKKYSPEISNVVKPKDLGISKSYKDWAGHTQIILPLEGNILKKSKADLTLSELGERVHEIGEKRASSVDKKKLTEIIIEKAVEEKKQIKEKKEEIAKDLESLEKKKKNLEVKLNEIGTVDSEKSEAKKLQKEKEEINDKIAKLEDTKTKLDAKEKSQTAESAAPPQTAVQPVEEKPAQKQETAKVEPPKEPSPEVVKLEKELEKVKEELAAKVEEKSKAEFSANVVDGKIPIIKIFPDGTCGNELHLLDPTKDDFVFKGNYTQICGKTFKDFGTGILVIGLKDNKENVRLVLLDKNELKPSTFSEAGIHPKSPLEVFDNFIYAIEFEGGKYYLSRFDATLKRMTRSDQEVLPDSTITIYGKKVYINARVEGGLVEIRIFNKDDLKFIKKTQT